LAKEKTDGIIRRISLASNWIEDKMVETHPMPSISLGSNESQAVGQLVSALRSYSGQENYPDLPEIIQSKIFEIARNNNILPKDFFKLLYKILLNKDKGPKLGNYAVDLGIERMCAILMDHIKR
jgi:lysyl-tRNA synthetase class 1